MTGLRRRTKGATICGIAGIYGVSALDVDAALDRIAHRGPDGRGVARVDDAVHGHVRLAIQDPHPRSNQPFVYGGVTLAYVGEIWNSDEIREELVSSTNSPCAPPLGVNYSFSNGYHFETTGDTEVVAAAIHRWGMGAMARLDGMFALSWTDSSGTYLARDRFGKVPLYWTPPGETLFGSGVAWASERRAFGDLAPEAVAVPPGTILDLSSDCSEAFYSPRGAVTLRAASGVPTGLPRRVRSMLEEGVSRRLVSDVPVCCLISGGMDSAAILALVREQVPDVVAYHAYRDPASPDLAAARRLCDEWEVELREVEVQDPTEEDVRAAVEAIEVPMKAQVEIALLCLPLARRLREDGFRVVLSGEAADEVFGGYGNLARKSGSDETWRAARLAAVEKMARGNFCRVNKVFMSAGVEGRLPFMERDLVELVLSLGVRDCPPGKGLLKEAVRGLIPDWVISREKATFQGAGGTIAACAGLYESPIKAYHQYARDLFGMIPRE